MTARIDARNAASSGERTGRRQLIAQRRAGATAFNLKAPRARNKPIPFDAWRQPRRPHERARSDSWAHGERCSDRRAQRMGAAHANAPPQERGPDLAEWTTSTSLAAAARLAQSHGDAGVRPRRKACSSAGTIAALPRLQPTSPLSPTRPPGHRCRFGRPQPRSSSRRTPGPAADVAACSWMRNSGLGAGGRGRFAVFGGVVDAVGYRSHQQSRISRRVAGPER